MNRDEWDILLSRYLDGTATDSEVEQVDRQLAVDPSAAASLFEAARYDVLFRDALTPVASDAQIQSSETAPVSDRLAPFAWRTRRWVAIAACLLVGAVLVWQISGRDETRKLAGGTSNSAERAPVLRLTAGGAGVTIDRATGSKTAGAEGTLSVADRIKTNASASANIGYDGESTRLTLGPASALSIADASAGKRFELNAGSVDCRVDKQKPGRPLVIDTPQARVTVVGTRFRLSVLPGWTRLTVSEGIVRVTRQQDGASVDISANEFVDVTSPGATRPASATTKAVGRDMGEFWSTKVRPAGIDQ